MDNFEENPSPVTKDSFGEKQSNKAAQNVKEWLNILSLSRLFRWAVYVFLGSWIYLNWQENLPVGQLAEKYAFPDSKFIAIEGMDVHYRKTGKGEPLLLLHDSGSSLHTWAAWTSELSASNQVISVDLPGFGLTGAHPRGSYSAFMYAGFLEKLIDSLGLKTFNLAGNGLGGQIAWFYAAEHPGKIKKLLLLAPQGFEKRSAGWVNLLAKTPLLNSVMHKITPKHFVKIFLEDIFADDKLVTDSLTNRHFELFLFPGTRKAYTDRAQVTENNPPVEDFIGKINCPTLILWGAEDTQISPENAYLFHKKMRKADLKIFENTGHWLQEENPKLTADDAKAFLEGRF